jgi:hypothetical protein
MFKIIGLDNKNYLKIDLVKEFKAVNNMDLFPKILTDPSEYLNKRCSIFVGNINIGISKSLITKDGYLVFEVEKPEITPKCDTLQNMYALVNRARFVEALLKSNDNGIGILIGDECLSYASISVEEGSTLPSGTGKFIIEYGYYFS